jgi:hypothetical protein
MIMTFHCVPVSLAIFLQRLTFLLETEAVKRSLGWIWSIPRTCDILLLHQQTPYPQSFRFGLFFVTAIRLSAT